MIVIIGGGICGLSVGWYLAREGQAVTVFERDQAGHGATWAAAGMIAAHIEAEPGEEMLLPLMIESRRMWPDFARELEAASGISVDYRDEGTLVVALDRDDAEQLKFMYDFHRSLGLNLEWLSGHAARELETHLAPRVTAGVFSPDDHQVDNRKAALALKAAVERAGGEVRERAPVDEILSENGRITGVRVGDDVVAADTVVLAAGAWSRNIAGLPEDSRPPVRPVKGQMLSLQMPPGAPLIEHVVWGPRVYMAPRFDGTLVIGSTVEEKDFDTTLTGGGIYELLRRAWETLPGIYDLPLVEMWAGLRPTSRDDAPLLGPAGLDGLVIATGHHRAGILLAPVTAWTISRFVLTGEVAEEMKPFTPMRFAA